MDNVDYIKVDAEGAEWHILKGAVQTLRRFKPIITFEFGEASYRNYGVVPESVYAYLEDMGYRVYDIKGRKLDQAGFAASSARQEVWDYIAIPAGHDEEALLKPLRQAM